MLSLGLDASTTTCGFVITDEHRKIHAANFIDITPYNTNREKAWAIIDHLKKKEPLFTKIDRVNLEAALSGFSGGSSRTVVIKLARFNATLEYVLQDVFPFQINLVNATTARKQAFGKARVKGVKPKVYVKSMVDTLYDMTPWTIKNRIGNPDKRMEDVLDALVISLYTPPK